MFDHQDEESQAQFRALKERVIALCESRAKRLPHARQRAYATTRNAFHRAEEELHERSRSLPWSTDFRIADAIYTDWYKDSEKAHLWKLLREEEHQLLRWAVEEMHRRGLGDTSEMQLVQCVADHKGKDGEALEAVRLALEL